MAATLACLASAGIAGAASPYSTIVGTGAPEGTGCPELFTHLACVNETLDLYVNHDFVYHDGCRGLTVGGLWDVVDEHHIFLHFYGLPACADRACNCCPSCAYDVICYMDYIDGRVLIWLDGDLFVSEDDTTGCPAGIDGEIA